MSDILEIRMQSGTVECAICGNETEHRWGVPTYNGDVVSNDFPEEMWTNGGGGVSVCRWCHRMHERGELVTYDHWYLPRSPFGLALIDGAGI